MTDTIDQISANHKDALDDIIREGARRMLIAALEAEVQEYIDRYKDCRDETGRAKVVRNGHANPRNITTGCGTIEVSAPRVNDKRVDEQGQRQRFSSSILPPYMRRSPEVSEVLPILYLRGLSTGDFKPALTALLGEQASGLSATNIARLTNVWKDEYRQWRSRSLADEQYAYIWADGIHFRVRLEENRLCCLVLMGVRSDGTKEPLAVEDGYRESKDSWLEVLRHLSKRGMKAPRMATGDGALGFWAALREVWPQCQEQRCWVHKIANVLDKMPKRVQKGAKEVLHQIMEAASREDAEAEMASFKTRYEAKWPKAVECLFKDADELLTFFSFPAAHWRHIRTTNPIESAFATVRLRQRVTKGAGSRVKALTMAFKLLEMAQKRWRRINGYQLLDDVLAGVQFVDGEPVDDVQKDAA